MQTPFDIAHALLTEGKSVLLTKTVDGRIRQMGLRQLPSGAFEGTEFWYTRFDRTMGRPRYRVAEWKPLTAVLAEAFAQAADSASDLAIWPLLETRD